MLIVGALAEIGGGGAKRWKEGKVEREAWERLEKGG